MGSLHLEILDGSYWNYHKKWIRTVKTHHKISKILILCNSNHNPFWLKVMANELIITAKGENYWLKNIEANSTN